MKRVLFDHKSHEKKTKTCRGCHHETLNACKKCHGLSGNPDGKWVNLSSAYHDAFSEKSCTGCHGIKKSEKGCAGCHHHLQEIDFQAIEQKKAICSLCHRGKKEAPAGVLSISVSEIYTQKIPKKIKIKPLEREYEPAIFPHLKVIKKLVQISNGSKMATYFHRNLQTICEGCHHNRHLEAEAKKNIPPSCRNCHPISFDPQNINKPRLLAAYHRRCMGCHEKMNLKFMECNDCHKEKAKPTGG